VSLQKGEGTPEMSLHEGLEERPQEDTVRRQPSASRKEFSPETKFDGSLIGDIQLADL